MPEDTDWYLVKIPNPDDVPKVAVFADTKYPPMSVFRLMACCKNIQHEMYGIELLLAHSIMNEEGWRP